MKISFNRGLRNWQLALVGLELVVLNGVSGYFTETVSLDKSSNKIKCILLV